MSRIRVVVAEDYEPFRWFIYSKLSKRPELEIICDVSDGLEALRKAQELQPDLILLDIGLPGLNGMEAARQIRQLSPQSRILFLTLESDRDVVEESLRMGVLGYVLKKDAGSDLLAAVEAVCHGRRFVSRSLSHHNFIDDLETQAAAPFLIKGVSCLDQELKGSHEAPFYPNDASFIVGLGRFVGRALEAGSAVIVHATKSHRESLFEQLHQEGVDCAAALQEGRYIAWDPVESLATLMIDGLPDPVRFWTAAEDAVASATQAAKGAHPRVVVCGEGTSLLWAQGNPGAAIQFERLWDRFARRYSVDILCGYTLNSQYEPENHIYQKVCAEHSAVSSQWTGR